MKKKTVKKLVLAKETVRSLENSALSQAAGATVYGCDPTTESWNNSCQMICHDEAESKNTNC